MKSLLDINENIRWVAAVDIQYKIIVAAADYASCDVLQPVDVALSFSRKCASKSKPRPV
jgi:hypothetical protein